MKKVELPSIGLLVFCYCAFGALTYWAAAIGPIGFVILLVPVLVLHSSLQHEFIHGHPFENQSLNDMLASPPLGLFVPYLRFKETHLAHHHDPNLTDPYDDPESNFLDPKAWNRLPKWRQKICLFNNTLIGRMLIGPFMGLLQFYGQDLRTVLDGQRPVIFAYLHHMAGMAAVLWWFLAIGTAPLWAYVLACYLAMSVLKIRTFLEHTAHERACARTVLIEDRGVLALLFLNNNYHLVHHASPKTAWHQLPALFNSRRDDFLRRNDGYWYGSYWTIFREFLFRRKDPVAHPLMPGGPSDDGVMSPTHTVPRDKTPGRQKSLNPVGQ